MLHCHFVYRRPHAKLPGAQAKDFVRRWHVIGSAVGCYIASDNNSRYSLVSKLIMVPLNTLRGLNDTLHAVGFSSFREKNRDASRTNLVQ